MGINDGAAPPVWQVEFNGRRALGLGPQQLAAAARYRSVVAIVAYDKPTEAVLQYAPYTLKVNGVVQPGGASAR